MSNARNISKADSRFVNATGDTISGIVNNESKVGIKVGSSPDTNLEVATRYSYNYTENMAIKVRNSESGYNNHMYLGSIGSSMIIDGARYYGGGAWLFEDSEASMIQMNNGATNFHARTGATAGGSSYSFPQVMGIDAQGRVTMPEQPYVTVGGSSLSYTSTTGVQPLNLVLQGNTAGTAAYNTSTYRFTAPVTGLYQVSFHSLWQTSSSNEIAVRVNGSMRARFYTQGDRGIHGTAHYRAAQGDYFELLSDVGLYMSNYSNPYTSVTYRLVG